MAWDGFPDAPPSVRITTLLPQLKPTEKRVLAAILEDLNRAVELTAQELADLVRVGRASVIRAAQKIGYDGYPQLRVALTRELAVADDGPLATDDGTYLGQVRAASALFSTYWQHSTSMLTESALSRCVAKLDQAPRVLVVANGLSAPVGLDLVLRLNSAGRPAEQLTDSLAQRISAQQLGAESMCLVISGSGANRSTLAVMQAAQAAGAEVHAITSFVKSAIGEQADNTLVIPPVRPSFQDELRHTSRAALMFFGECLVELLLQKRGAAGRDARLAVLSVLGETLEE